jgi:hypothetical protein
MSATTSSFTITTRGKGTYEITDAVARILSESRVQTGLVTVFIQHTSASLVIYENADPSARVDLNAFFDRLVPEDSDYFVHTDEGPMICPRTCAWCSRARARRFRWPRDAFSSGPGRAFSYSNTAGRRTVAPSSSAFWAESATGRLVPCAGIG